MATDLISILQLSQGLQIIKTDIIRTGMTTTKELWLWISRNFSQSLVNFFESDVCHLASPLVLLNHCH
ncbi:hypothetical protein Dimus_003224 [Dionaea muscipula]